MRRVFSVFLITILAGCSSTTATEEEPPDPDRVESPRTALTSAATESLDARYSAEYEWSEGSRVMVDLAKDGTWMIRVDGWGHEGDIDVSYAWTTGGFYQCRYEPENQCVKIASITGAIPDELDPKVEKPFISWLPILADQHSPYVVGEEDGCFVLTGSTAVVDTPIPEGTWCFDENSQIESVTVDTFGSLDRTKEVDGVLETVELPGEIVDGDPVPREKPEEPEDDDEDDAEDDDSEESEEEPDEETDPETDE